MRNRLVAFGCSTTFGHGLKDCFVPPLDPGHKPSLLAWPQLVANKLDRQCINKGVPGASNKLIWNIVMNTQYRHSDIAIISWSYPERWCIIKSIENAEDIKEVSIYDESKASKAFYKHIHNEADMDVDLNLRMHHTHLYLNSLGVQNYHTVLDRDIFNRQKWNSAPMLTSDFEAIRQLHPRALDNSHPGPGAHQQHAEEIYNEITVKQ